MINYDACKDALEFLELKDVKEIFKSGTTPRSDDPNSVGGAFVVYLDESCRLRYCEDRYVVNERDFEFRRCIGKIAALNAQPLNVDDQQSRMNFHEMLACAYAQASYGNLPSAYMFIGKAKEYYRSITTERARKCSLNTTGWIVLTVSLFAFIMVYARALFQLDIPYYEWLSGMYMGILGASVSIWQRYGRIEFTGYAPKSLYKLEIGARIVYGVISSIVLITAVKDGWITSSRLVPPENISVQTVMLLGFIAGFFERLVPSIAEQFVHETRPKTKKIYKPVDMYDNENKQEAESDDKREKIMTEKE